MEACLGDIERYKATMKNRRSTPSIFLVNKQIYAEARSLLIMKPFVLKV